RAELEKIVPERRHHRSDQWGADDIKAQEIRSDPAGADEHQVRGEHDVLEQPRVRLQHRPCAASRIPRYAATCSLNRGRSNVSARARSAFGEKRPADASNFSIASASASASWAFNGPSVRGSSPAP